jgi:putative salt-induced outer membrane protein YdiY
MKARCTRFRVTALASTFLFCGFAPPAQAQQTNATPSYHGAATNSIARSNPATTNKWSGPEISDDFDWIELTSGEWLKGEIKSMQDDKLEFDSDKLDLLKLDWEDVRQVRTRRTQTVLTEQKDQYTGSLRIDEKLVMVTNPEGVTTTFDRSELLGLVAGKAREINYWSFKLGAGATYQTGNTKQTDINVNARVQRRTAGNRLNLSYLGVFTTTDEVETANNHRATATFDVFLTRRLFVRPVFGEYYEDKFQNIEHQATLGVEVGYTLIDTSKTEWDIHGGPGYRYTKFVSVQPGESSEESTPAFLAGTTWDRELTDWMDANISYNFGIMNERSGTYTHHLTAGLSIELTSKLDLDLTAVWDHVQTPQQTSAGSTPDQDDFRFLVGVSVDL